MALIGQVFLGPALQPLEPSAVVVEREPVEQRSAVIQPGDGAN